VLVIVRYQKSSIPFRQSPGGSWYRTISLASFRWPRQRIRSVACAALAESLGRKRLVWFSTISSRNLASPLSKNHYLRWVEENGRTHSPRRIHWLTAPRKRTTSLAGNGGQRHFYQLNETLAGCFYARSTPTMSLASRIALSSAPIQDTAAPQQFGKSLRKRRKLKVLQRRHAGRTMYVLPFSMARSVRLWQKRRAAYRSPYS